MTDATPSPGSAALAPLPTLTCAVTVVVHVRPLAPHEGGGPPAVVGLQQQPSWTAQPTTAPPLLLPSLSCGGQAFTVDAFYDSGATAAPVDHRPALYAEQVAPLIAGLFAGVNAAVFAYGATGSGKTHTMGLASAAWEGEGACGASAATQGIIPRAVADVFATAEGVRAAAPATTAVTVRASFVEVLNEDVRDLLAVSTPASSTTPASLSIREAPGGKGGVCLAGAVEAPVASAGELAVLLSSAGARRATQATALNAASSRSHAVVTLTVEVHKKGEGQTEAKLQLVDLAGSERAKRTLAGGARLREAAHINMGLLALGNVINALVQQQQLQQQQAGAGGRRRLSTGAGGEGAAMTTTPPLLPPSTTHIPYRASKLTRLLSDALGGSARSIMVACCSPAPGDLTESRATLRWAARARAIRNTPTTQHGDDVAGLRAALGAARVEGEALRAALAALQAGTPAAPAAAPSPAAPSPGPSTTPAPALRSRIAGLEAALASAAAREAARAAASATRRASQRCRESSARAEAEEAARARLAAAAVAVEAGVPPSLPLPSSPTSAAAWVEAEAALMAAAAELQAGAEAAAVRLAAAEGALDALPDGPAGGGRVGTGVEREVVAAAVGAREAAEAAAAGAAAPAAAASEAAAGAAARRAVARAGAPPPALAALVEAGLLLAAAARARGGLPPQPPPRIPPSPALTPRAPLGASHSSPAAAWRGEADGAVTRAAAVRARTEARRAAAARGTTPGRLALASHPLAVADADALAASPPPVLPARLVFGALENSGRGGGMTPLGGKLGALALEEGESWQRGDGGSQ